MALRNQFLPINVDPIDGAVVANFGRYHKQAIDAAFHAIGGQEKLNEVAAEDPKWFYTTLWSKRIPKEVEVEASDGLDTLIRRLEAGERATVIEGNATEVENES